MVDTPYEASFLLGSPGEPNFLPAGPKRGGKDVAGLVHPFTFNSVDVSGSRLPVL